MFKRDVLNKILLLKLIGMADGISGATRLQKLIFSAEHLGRKNKKPTFNYSFIRWHYGPYSAEVKKDVEFLHEHGFIDIYGNTYLLNEKGKRAIGAVADMLEEYNTTEMLESVIRRYEGMSLDELLERVYKAYKIETNFEKGEIILPLYIDEVGENK
jgi:uncharacterized protein YwgA